MENAVDALKMAFAVLVFVIALTLCMTTMTKARETADAVFYITDRTNYFEYVTDKRLPEGRIVSGETIIPTLYRYYKENFNVIILDKSGNKIAVYNLEEEIKKYNSNYKNAPWLGNANIDTKTRVDVDVSGVEQSINGVNYKPDYKKNTNITSLLDYLKNRRFKETFLEQRYSGKEVTSEDNESIELVKGNTKLWIIYQEYTENNN